MNPSIIKNNRLSYFFVCAVLNYKMVSVSVNKFWKKLVPTAPKNLLNFEYCDPLNFPIADCSDPVNIRLPIGIDQSFVTGTRLHYISILSAAFVFR